MITGFNTDIEHNGVVYHVQTEDKGLATPLILSLVYDRGTILASKRSRYDDLIAGGFEERALAERLQKQHKLICAAVRAGRIEDLKKLSERDAVRERDGGRPSPEAAAPAPVQETAAAPPAVRRVPPEIAKPAVPPPVPVPDARPIPQPEEELVWELPLEIIEDELLVEPVRIVEDPIVVDEAVRIMPEPAPSPADDSLRIRLLTPTAFRSGERKTLRIGVFRGSEENSVADAQVMVKVLGSNFRPLIFHSRTDADGAAVVHLQLPQFRSGRAALLIRALSGGEESELRQIIRPY